ncbi:MAG: tRNA-intron lyase [Candidatus Thorarchaeota archaeon]|nr:tRNA-intron lyase [Candidatus Thorarchaeota archaeon]
MTGKDDNFSEQEASEDVEELEVEEEVVEEPAEAIFENGKGYVGSEDADRISQQGFYGNRIDNNRLELEPVELLHLIERKRLVVRKPDGETIGPDYIVSELLDEDPDLWTRYLVFRDLRSRGYAVRQGFGSGIGFRVYARGDRPGAASANQLVYVLKEGAPISLSDLDMVTQTAAGSRKDLVFALVDQNGEVNFYRVAQATLRDRGSDEDGEQ